MRQCFFTLFFIIPCNLLFIDYDPYILLHLKPEIPNDLEFYIKKLDEFNDLIDIHVIENNITQFLDVLNQTHKENPTAAYWPLSVLSSWGIGVPQDSRLAFTYLNFGVLSDEFLPILSYNHKSLFGIYTETSCGSVFEELKSYSQQLVRNLTLFEQALTDSYNIRLITDKSYVIPPESDLIQKNKIVDSVLSQIEGLYSHSDTLLTKFFRSYISTSLTDNQELTRKIYNRLEIMIKNHKSGSIAPFLALLHIESGGAIPVNHTKAVELMNQADMSHPYSNLVMGILYFYGLGMETDYKSAYVNFRRALSFGLNEASAYIGIMHLLGVGINANSQDALKYLMIGTSNKYLLSLYGLGLMHEYGIGVFKSCEFSSRLYNLILEKKIISKVMFKAKKDFSNKQYYKAYIKYIAMADLGSNSAMINAATMLEDCHFHFYSKEEKQVNAFRLWKQASTQGNVEATIKMGDYYYYGLGTEQNYKEAIDSYFSAANHYLNPQAMYNLGYMYEFGLGVGKNYFMAERYYDMARAADPNSFFLISLMSTRLRIKIQYHHILKLNKSFFSLITGFASSAKITFLQDTYTMFIFITSFLFVYLLKGFIAHNRI